MKKQSKFLSLILRHNPSAGNLTLDKEGWASVKDVLKALQTTLKADEPRFTREDLDKLVAENDKKRFAFNDKGDKIRANQGHSVEVDLKLMAQFPPDILYHGTSKKALDSIFEHGLTKQKRQHVHLSRNIETAHAVGSRSGARPVILSIRTGEMAADGHEFFESLNSVWLTDRVPPEYITVIDNPFTRDDG